MVEALQPNAVIAAIGGKPIMLNVPGIDKKNVFEATEITSEKRISELRQKSIIIGGNMVGCETALEIIKRCPQKDIVILEMGERLAASMLMTYRIGVMERLNYNVIHAKDFRNITEKNEHVSYFVKMKVTEITDDGVKAVDVETGEEKFFADDSVIMAVGVKGSTEEAESFDQCALDFTMIGDCLEARDIECAVNEGYNAAISLESYL